jgi:hypothetical protein
MHKTTIVLNPPPHPLNQIIPGPVEQENHKKNIFYFEIDLIAPPPQSRTSQERKQKMVGNEGTNEKFMIMDSEIGVKHKNEDDN